MPRTHKQVALAWAAASTGVAAIVLPFTFSTSPADVVLQWARPHGTDFFRLGTLWPIALPFFLALPVGLASFSGGRAGWTAGGAVAAWMAAALGAALPLSFVARGLLHELPSQASEWLAIAAFLAALAVGAISLRQTRSTGHSRTTQSMKAMQLAYLPNAVFCLIAIAPPGEWQVGAWCVVATAVLYIVQLAAGRAVEGRARVPASGSAARCALLTALLALGAASSVSAQAVSSARDWAAVRNLAVGEKISVVTTSEGPREYRMAFADEYRLVVVRPFRRMRADVLEAMRRVGANWPAVLGGRVFVHHGTRIWSGGIEDGTAVVAGLEVVPRSAVLAVIGTRAATTADALLDIAGMGAFLAASRSASGYDLEAQRRYDALPGSPPLSAQPGSGRQFSRWHVFYQAPAGGADALSEESWHRLLEGLPRALRGARQE